MKHLSILILFISLFFVDCQKKETFKKKSLQETFWSNGNLKTKKIKNPSGEILSIIIYSEEGSTISVTNYKDKQVESIIEYWPPDEGAEKKKTLYFLTGQVKQVTYYNQLNGEKIFETNYNLDGSIQKTFPKK